MKKTISRAISTLNSLGVGDLDRIRKRLDEVMADLGTLEAEELITMLTDARTALDRGDVPLFRRRVQHAVSRLGHLR
jgi:DNA integrity scanning protein DisA with diadenylate cyclase activity